MRRLVHSALAIVLLASPALACSVPVFRYALENWEPDRLTVAVLHGGQLDDATEALVDQMTEASEDADDLVNLRLHPIDVEADHREGSAEAFHAERWKDKQLPHMLVYFSNNAPEPQLAWSAELNEQNVDRLVDSPARKQVVERLLDGQSAVWVLLKSGNQDADDRAERILREELAKKPDEIELPSLTDLATEEKFNEDLGVEMRVEFSLITIAPDDEDEVFFREMLLNTESDLKDFDAPIAIPVYGRGRTYFALVGPGITADNISDNCNFICGACSCEVKRDNPGQDLLLAANWNQVQPGNWVSDTPLPVLTGIGGLEAAVEEAEAANEEAAAETVRQEQVSKSSDLASDTQLASLDRTAANASQIDRPVAEATAVETISDSVDPPLSEAATGTQAPSNSSSADTIVLVGGWAGVLLCLGVGFTVWQRRQED